MRNIVFKPWVGNDYATNKFGARILVLGESHYGVPEDEHEEYTKEVVQLWAKENRLAFFTKIAKTILNLDSSEYLTDDAKTEFWENVAFYNYIQKIVGEGARIRPASDMWESSAPALFEVIKDLDPQIIYVLGKELADNLPQLPSGIEVCYLSHPSSGGYSYAENNSKAQKAIEIVKKNDDLLLQQLLDEKKLDTPFKVTDIQRKLHWGYPRATNVCERGVVKGTLTKIEKDDGILYLAN